MAMHARIVAAAVLLCAALGASYAGGQPATPQELVTDPAGDQAVTFGTLVTTPPAFDNVDLLTVSAQQPEPGTLVLTVTTQAAVTATQNVTLSFAVERGPTSLPSSNASGEAYSVLYHGDRKSVV